MDATADATTPHAAAPGGSEAAAPAINMPGILKMVSSLRLTVVLLAMSMVLILAGTLAQVNEGVWTAVAKYFRSPFTWIEFQLFVPKKLATIPGAIPFPGGLTLGVLLFVNLLAAHLVRFKLSWKRAGIITAHVGVLLLLVGEFVTGAMATEGNMTIWEGGSSSYVEDNRTVELAIIDPSDPKEDDVVVIPHHILESSRGTISRGIMPFDVTVNEWMPNSHLLGPMQATAAQRAKADAGAGLQVAAVPAPKATGVDGAGVDVPSAYVTFSKGGRKIANHLVSVYLERPDEVEVDGKKYEVSLRFTRTYKPYTLTLLDFRHDKFVGTDKPKNFSSHVRLVDPTRNVDREVVIWMNNPLRHAGETFYQASFKQGDTGTVLQVVRNPGWLLPYLSCTLVTLGLLAHFGIRMVTSSRRRLS
jgi:hypothetical protein